MKNILKAIKEWLRIMSLRVSLKERSAFARRLSVMAKAGIPILQSVNMLKEQAQSRAMKQILSDVSQKISQGGFLADALEPYKPIFGNLFISVIRVGETAGVLSENLAFLADEMHKQQELKRKIIGALVYPVVILVATFGITALLTVFIFPRIIPVFANLDIELPATTRFLIFLNNLFRDYGVIIIAAVLGFIAVFWISLRFHLVKFWWTLFLFRMPILGTMLKNANLASMTRTLGLTLRSEIKIVDALAITAESISNVVYKREIKLIAENVKQGGTLAQKLKDNPFLFPSLVTQMVSVGENTGSLSEMLLRLSDFYEAELTSAIKNLTNILEPLLMVLMGVIVGFIAISIISPIYQVSQIVGR